MTGLTCMVLLSSDSTQSHNIKGGLISKEIFNLVPMSKKMSTVVKKFKEIQDFSDFKVSRNCEDYSFRSS